MSYAYSDYMIQLFKKNSKPLIINGYNDKGQQVVKQLVVDGIIQSSSYAYIFHPDNKIEFLPGKLTGYNLIDGMITLYYDHGGYIEINR